MYNCTEQTDGIADDDEWDPMEAYARILVDGQDDDDDEDDDEEGSRAQC